MGSDRKTKLHVLFNFQEDNKWELKVDRVPGQKMTIEATVNGQKWTGVGNLNQGEMKLNLKMDSEFSGKHFNMDFDLNPSGMWGLHVTGDVDGPVDIKWTMQKDFTMGEISMKYKNQNYAFMQLKGNAEMRGMIPVMFHYVVKYNIQDAEQQQGKAKLLRRLLVTSPGSTMATSSRSSLMRLSLRPRRTPSTPSTLGSCSEEGMLRRWIRQGTSSSTRSTRPSSLTR